MGVARASVPRAGRLLDPRWWTDSLRESYPDVTVSSARVDGGDSGTTDRIRVRLSYAAGSGPPVVFVKKQGNLSHRMIVSATGMLSNEARFYAQASDVPIDKPRAYATGTSRGRLDSILLLEDVAAVGARPNVATSPLTLQQCAAGLEGLAGLHAHYWPGDGGTRDLAWLPQSMGGLIWLATVWAGAVRGIPRARAAGLPLPGSTGDARKVSAQWWHHCRRAASAPEPTVVHGDAHVGNTYLRPDGQVGFLDWQLVGRGGWFFDVPYFIVGALSVSDRRAGERDLIAHYVSALRTHGVAAIDVDEAWAEHQRCSAYGLAMWLCTLGFGSYQAPEICLAYIDRYSSAVLDHLQA